jgi:transposase-like protein
MLNLGKVRISVTCPKCQFANVIRLEQVELEQRFICEGCLETIQLKDAAKSTRKAVGAIEGAVEDLEKRLKGGLA